jgi:hypothetical protein
VHRASLCPIGLALLLQPCSTIGVEGNVNCLEVRHRLHHFIADLRRGGIVIVKGRRCILIQLIRRALTDIQAHFCIIQAAIVVI